jgi:hypothetical protein
MGMILFQFVVIYKYLPGMTGENEANSDAVTFLIDSSQQNFRKHIRNASYWNKNFGTYRNKVASKIFRTGAAIYTAVVVARERVDSRTTMSSESVCHVARSWVDVGSFHTRLVMRFMNFTASFRNILDTLSYG